jgi:hypothetical protein
MASLASRAAVHSATPGCAFAAGTTAAVSPHKTTASVMARLANQALIIPLNLVFVRLQRSLTHGILDVLAILSTRAIGFLGDFDALLIGIASVLPLLTLAFALRHLLHLLPHLPQSLQGALLSLHGRLWLPLLQALTGLSHGFADLLQRLIESFPEGRHALGHLPHASAHALELLANLLLLLTELVHLLLLTRRRRGLAHLHELFHGFRDALHEPIA